MYKQVVLGISLAAFSLACHAQMQTIKVNGTVSASAQLTTPSAESNALTSAPVMKNVKLMKLDLTPAQKHKFLQTKSASLLKNVKSSQQQDLPSSADVGMNGVPVLDQGQHGTCATFANTAAVDAILGRGDYVSQLCQLTVGTYIERRSYSMSGWDGSFGPYVLNQMLHYGIASKDNQRVKKCGGLAEYPGDDEYETGRAMSLDAFKTISEKLDDEYQGTYFYWRPILDIATRFGMDDTSAFDPENVLNQVKQTLASKDQNSASRVTFGVSLPYRHCSAGACARTHKRYDTWALTQEILDDTDPDLGGHEMIITGYDDDAIAKDKQGGEHKGLLTIRNSWGEDVGDKGNFYMTYDYFKKFVMEVQKVAIARNLQ